MKRKSVCLICGPTGSIIQARSGRVDLLAYSGLELRSQALLWMVETLGFKPVINES